MPISITCGSCSAVLRVKDQRAGTRGRCPRCKTAFDIPSPVDAPARRATDEPAERLRPTEIVAAFDGDISPIHRSAAYHIGILIVALTIPFLPIVYFALIGSVGYLIYLHATVSIHGIKSMHSI